MNFDLHIQNIGKLTDAKIRIGRFTVFAGPNNTGKSFVSKILYSLFNAMNANHAEVHMNNLLEPILEPIETLQILALRNSDTPFSLLIKEIEETRYMVASIPVGDFEMLNDVIPKLAEKASKMQSVFSDIRSSIEAMMMQVADRHDDGDRSLFERKMGAIEKELILLEENLRNTKVKDFIAGGTEYKIEENLIQTFQIPNLSGLRGTEETSAQVDIHNFGRFELSDKDIRGKIHRSFFGKLRQFSNVVYVESPVYWKLKSTLEDLRIRPRFMSKIRERLSGVPGYFYDLASALRSQYTGEMAFKDVYEKLTGKEVLGGKIVISETGALMFQENSRSFTMPVTAMGVANLGILALLIERKVLDQETFIFIDEPEAHLHPAWQVVMAETLFALAKGGAHVVIATHSADILKWLEVHVKKHPEDEKLVALNKFPVNGDAFVEHDFGYKMAAIKGKLTKPFADLYTAGL